MATRRIQAFGVHVHVGLRDGSKAIPIVNALAAYLPHFLALTASSPFWDGHGTGLASSRAVIFAGLPTAGPPQSFADGSELEEYMDTLMPAGTIRSVKEVCRDARPHPGAGRAGNGASHEGQRAVTATGGGLTHVVDALVSGFAEDQFACPGKDRDAGR